MHKIWFHADIAAATSHTRFTVSFTRISTILLDKNEVFVEFAIAIGLHTPASGCPVHNMRMRSHRVDVEKSSNEPRGIVH